MAEAAVHSLSSQTEPAANLQERVAFVTANFVARAGNYAIRPFDWGKCHNRTVETFTVAEMEKICAEVATAGFRFLDLWIAHAHAPARDQESLGQFKAILDKYNLSVVAAGIGLGGTQTNRKEIERDFTTLVGLGVPLLAGPMEKEDVPVIAEWCERYGVRAAIENHPEKRAEEILEKIGDYGRWVGACCDTGWWGTQGADAARETVILRNHLFHVHLKDVREAGSHHTCAYGEGIVNIRGVLNILQKTNYSGFVSIEHEPEYIEPMEDVKRSRELVLNHIQKLSESTTTNKCFRVASVGAGGVWNYHAKNLWQIPSVEIAGHCDASEQKAQETARRFGGQSFTSAAAMLDTLNPDAVWICTPQDVRMEPIQACVERKIPFFCEKPPAFDLQTARRVASILETSNVLHTIGFMWRHLKMNERAREFLSNRPIPVVRSRLMCSVMTDPALPAWFLVKERSGGQVLDQAIHIIDLLRYFLGEIRRVHAHGGNIVKQKSPTITVEDSTVLSFEFESGTIGTHAHSWVIEPYVAEIEFFSSQFELKLDYVRNRLDGTIDGNPIHEQFRDNPYLRELEVFIEAVRTDNREILRSTYFDAMKTLAVALAGNRSLETGKPQDVDLD